MSGRKPTLAALLVLALFISVAAAPQQRRSARRERTPTAARQPASELICNVFCSQDKPGTAVAEITWKLADVEIGPRAFASRLSRQELEVTVVKGGFARGMSANLFSAERDPRFRSLRPPSTQGGEPGLEDLTVTDVRRLGDEEEGAGRESRFNEGLSGARPSTRAGGEAVVVRVEGLKPGLNYFWRVPTGSGSRRTVSEVVKCQPPPCPVDTRRAPPSP